MGHGQKITGRASSIPKGLLIGGSICMLITMAISAVSAHMVSTEMIPQSSIGYCAMTALLTASCIGAWCAVGKIKRMPFQIAMMNGAVFFGMLLALTALFFGGQYQGMGVSFLLVAAGSVAGGILASRQPKTKNRVGRKKIYR